MATLYDEQNESAIQAVRLAANSATVDSSIKRLSEIEVLLLAAHDLMVEIMRDSLRCDNMHLYESLKIKSVKLRQIARDTITDFSGDDESRKLLRHNMD